MRLIDAEQYRKEFLDSRDFEPMKILDFQPTIKAIPLDKVKQAKKKMTAYIEPTTGQWTSGFNNGVNTCLEILDSLIAESEEE